MSAFPQNAANHGTDKLGGTLTCQFTPKTVLRVRGEVRRQGRARAVPVDATSIPGAAQRPGCAITPTGPHLVRGAGTVLELMLTSSSFGGF